MRLIIPGVLPSVNHMYRNVQVGKRSMKILTPEAEAWKSEIIIRASNWRQKTKWKTTPKKTKVIVYLWYYFPDWHIRDSHNTQKLMLDCFEDALIYENDQFALPRIMDLQVDKENPRTEIQFEVMEG